MGHLLGREKRGVCGEREVNTREGYQVGLEFVQIDVEGTAEPERSCNRRHYLGDQPIQVGKAGLGNVQALLAYIVNGLVVHLQERCNKIVYKRVRKTTSQRQMRCDEMK